MPADRVDVCPDKEVKHSANVTRPDGSNNHSFPSGHTAMAFMAATMLHKEYGTTRSPWYSIGGYTVATATAVSRRQACLYPLRNP